MQPLVKLIGITQGAGELVNKNAQEVVSYIARVSNPNNQLNFDTASGLIRYCIKHNHLSIFEHAFMSLEINTTRAIAAQILRHRSFTFQEFCLDGDVRITVSNENGATQKIPIRELYKKWNNKNFKSRYARSYNSELNCFIDAPILSVYSSGKKDVYEYTISGSELNTKIKCTREHKVFTEERGFVPFSEAYTDGLTVALIMGWGKIVNEEYLGIRETYDIEMDHPSHNFVAEGIVVHNSQRYADTKLLNDLPIIPDLRRQDNKNRQNSIDDIDYKVKHDLQEKIREYFKKGQELYDLLLENQIAKECARLVLPLSTQTRIYMSGSVRSWITYIALREKNGTQKEHMDIAKECKKIFKDQFNDCYDALGGDDDWEI